MLQLVNVGHKSLSDYATIATRGLMDEIRRLAAPLEGKRVVHLSATAFGGGVAEINYTLIPLMRDAGLDVEWRIIHGQEEFFNVTKAMHNGLQGAPETLSAEDREIYLRYQELNAREFEDDADFVIVHDPQPIGMIGCCPSSRAQWIWRCHIDLSTPNPDTIGFILPWLRTYDAAIFHRPQYVPNGATGLAAAYIWPPAIDPLAPKNMALSAEYANGDPDIYILSNLNNVGSVEVNAFQVHSSAVIQKSVREGFGLTVSEALWKARPTVAGRAGGIVDQITDGETGWLVGPPPHCALRSLVSHHDVTWVASAISDEDRSVAEEADGEAFDETAWDGSPYRLRLVPHDPQAYDWHYNVVSNPTLWFLQHYLWALAQEPNVNKGLHHAWDEGYVPVNRGFADAVLAELEREPDATVFFHDYHLYLAPRLVRDERPDATLAHFMHIPWPQPDYWRVLPRTMRSTIHDGLVANDVIGFHSDRWRRNFIHSTRELLGEDVTLKTVTSAISVDPAEFDELAASDAVVAAEQEILERRPEKLVVRVD